MPDHRRDRLLPFRQGGDAHVLPSHRQNQPEGVRQHRDDKQQGHIDLAGTGRGG